MNDGPDRPILLVIAGPNGAGKTTLTGGLRGHLWSQGVEFLNPDQVAQDEFGDWNDPRAQLLAAEKTTARRWELLRQGASFGFETVFSTREKVDFLRAAVQAGFFVRMFFVGVDDPSILVRRVAIRVRAGGHTVPADKIRKRYYDALVNLGDAIKLVDRAYLYDNSMDGQDARLCARTIDRSRAKRYSDLPLWISDALDDAGLGQPPHQAR